MIKEIHYPNNILASTLLKPIDYIDCFEAKSNFTTINDFARDYFLAQPTWLLLVSFVIKLIFGKEMPSELLVNGQSVSADQVSLCGYKFAYPTLEESLERILKKGDK